MIRVYTEIFAFGFCGCAQKPVVYYMYTRVAYNSRAYLCDMERYVIVVGWVVDYCADT